MFIVVNIGNKNKTLVEYSLSFIFVNYVKIKLIWKEGEALHIGPLFMFPLVHNVHCINKYNIMHFLFSYFGNVFGQKNYC